MERLKKVFISPDNKLKELLIKRKSSEIKTGISLYELLKRPEIKYDDLKNLDENLPNLTEIEKEQVDIEIKYEGYIKRQLIQVNQFKKLENKKLWDIDYSKLDGLRIEAKQKLNSIKPLSIGQASRVSGVSPADISVLMIYIEQMKRKA